MRLSELKTGESATVVKVMGYGGFRRRIMEMGRVLLHIPSPRGPLGVCMASFAL